MFFLALARLLLPPLLHLALPLLLTETTLRVRMPALLVSLPLLFFPPSEPSTDDVGAKRQKQYRQTHHDDRRADLRKVRG
jgi:hypothetical protein